MILLLASVLVSACEDSTCWVDAFDDGCDWYAVNGPGCTQYDLGNRENCPAVCGGCSSNQCDEELSGDQGRGYRGCQTTTRSGHTCQNWASQCPHTHMLVPASNPELVQNFCRNPSEGDTICCHTVTNLRWEYCDPLPRPPMLPPRPHLPHAGVAYSFSPTLCSLPMIGALISPPATRLPARLKQEACHILSSLVTFNGGRPVTRAAVLSVWPPVAHTLYSGTQTYSQMRCRVGTPTNTSVAATNHHHHHHHGLHTYHYPV